MAKEHDETNTPKSQQLREDAPMQASAVATTGTFGLKSPEKAKEIVARKQLQDRLDKIALTYINTHPAKKAEDDFVTIRAMKTHHPAPRCGTFNFQDVYNCFIEGMRYKCPRAVAMHLEETENATILG